MKKKIFKRHIVDMLWKQVRYGSGVGIMISNPDEAEKEGHGNDVLCFGCTLPVAKEQVGKFVKCERFYVFLNDLHGGRSKSFE